MSTSKTLTYGLIIAGILLVLGGWVYTLENKESAIKWLLFLVVMGSLGFGAYYVFKKSPLLKVEDVKEERLKRVEDAERKAKQLLVHKKKELPFRNVNQVVESVGEKGGKKDPVYLFTAQGYHSRELLYAVAINMESPEIHVAVKEFPAHLEKDVLEEKLRFLVNSVGRHPRTHEITVIEPKYDPETGQTVVRKRIKRETEEELKKEDEEKKVVEEEKI